MNPLNIYRLNSTLSGLLNKLISLSVYILFRKKIHIDFRTCKIINPTNIILNDRFAAGKNLWLETVGTGTISFGNNVNISDNVHIGASEIIEIGNGVLIGSNVLITDHSHGGTLLNDSLIRMAPNLRPIKNEGPVTIKDNVWIGNGVIILPGSIIGENSIIGANSIIQGTIKCNSVVANSKAKIVFYN